MSRRTGGDLGNRPRTKRLRPAEQPSKLLLLLVFCGLAAALVVQQQWLGLVACALGACVLWWPIPSTADPLNADEANPSTPAAPPLAEGTSLMAATVLPVWSRQLTIIQSSVQSATSELLSSFSSMLELQDQWASQLQALSAQNDHNAHTRQHLDQLSLISAQTRIEYDKVLERLQFGDRVSQMVDVLRQDTERFARQLPHMAQAAPADANAWLAALETRYTTDEQRFIHHDQAHTPQPSKVDFF